MQLLVAALLPLLLCACDPGETPDCVDHGDCRENQGCVLGQCRWVDCIDNTRCRLEHYCDPSTLTCIEGCQSDEDCKSGESCDTAANSCVSAGCRDTVLDCDYGKYCDLELGYCVTDDRAHCKVCDGLGEAICPAEGICVLYVDSSSTCHRDDDCRPDQNCDEFEAGTYCHEDRCQYECDPDDPDACPRGWMCQTTIGFPEIHSCTADCFWMEQQGIVEGGD